MYKKGRNLCKKCVFKDNFELIFLTIKKGQSNNSFAPASKKKFIFILWCKLNELRKMYKKGRNLCKKCVFKDKFELIFLTILIDS